MYKGFQMDQPLAGILVMSGYIPNIKVGSDQYYQSIQWYALSYNLIQCALEL